MTFILYDFRILVSEFRSDTQASFLCSKWSNAASITAGSFFLAKRFAYDTYDRFEGRFKGSLQITLSECLDFAVRITCMCGTNLGGDFNVLRQMFKLKFSFLKKRTL